MLTLVKSVLLSVSSVAFILGSKPPTPVPSQSSIAYRDQLFEYASLSRRITLLWQATFCMVMACHIAVMLALRWPGLTPLTEFASHVCHAPSPSLAQLASLSPTFMFGILLTVIGASLRVWCYKALGRLFTFEVTILDDHKLITTGPYAYVRHPSYTASCTSILGTSFIFFGANEYVAVCDLVETRFLFFYYLWMVLAPYAAFAMYRRADKEDVLMKQQFGAKWDKWREAVPYKFIPYLF